MTGIERFRRKSLMTQAQLAALLDVTPTSVSNWELGKATPRVEVFKRMSELFGVTVDELLRSNYPENDLALPAGTGHPPTQEVPPCSPAGS